MLGAACGPQPRGAQSGSWAESGISRGEGQKNKQDLNPPSVKGVGEEYDATHRVRLGARGAMSESKLEQIFFLYALKRRRAAEENNMRFVHYSSAEAAIKLITNREVWMRKARCMNDFSEIDYGMRCLHSAISTEGGHCLRTVLNGLFPGIVDEVARAFDGWFPSILENTYITCLSEHHSPKEDVLGRLSMWRAYGGATGVAIVVSPKPFLVKSHALGAYTSPVGYFTPTEFHQRFTDVINRVVAEQSFLGRADRGRSSETFV